MHLNISLYGNEQMTLQALRIKIMWQNLLWECRRGEILQTWFKSNLTSVKHIYNKINQLSQTNWHGLKSQRDFWNYSNTDSKYEDKAFCFVLMWLHRYKMVNHGLIGQEAAAGIFWRKSLETGDKRRNIKCKQEEF